MPPALAIADRIMACYNSCPGTCGLGAQRMGWQIGRTAQRAPGLQNRRSRVRVLPPLPVLPSHLSLPTLLVAQWLPDRQHLQAQSARMLAFLLGLSPVNTRRSG